VKRTREDEPPKARRGWQRGRGRPPENGDEGAAAAAARKRSRRSVFGPSGEDRPDMLTDAETVVLPVWLHHRPSSAGGTTAESAAAFLKTITVPAEPGEAPVTEPETGEAPATEPEAGAEAEASPGAGESGTAAG
jgi:hypothetical protein